MRAHTQRHTVGQRLPSDKQNYSASPDGPSISGESQEKPNLIGKRSLNVELELVTSSLFSHVANCVSFKWFKIDVRTGVYKVAPFWKRLNVVIWTLYGVTMVRNL